MEPKRPIETYNMERRLDLLPRKVYKAIYDEFMAMPRTTNTRWANITKDRWHHRTWDMRVSEAAIFIRHIGCNFQELIDPNVSLLDVFQREILKKEEKDVGEKYGLKAA